MNIPAEFDDIRPYSPEELPAVFGELLADPQFRALVQSFYPELPFEELSGRLYACKDNLEVQKVFFYPLIKQLVAKCCTGCTMDAGAVGDRDGRYTFVSNHRDIVIDPAFLSILLLDQGFPTTVEIAIGDNLLIYPWIHKLVRVNKSFIVQRSLPLREMLGSSRRMSAYMHYAVACKRENIWIAQREGRAKDSDDRTQEAVLKMMAMSGGDTAADSLKALNIVPLTISYEYDPCDFLKAKEFQQKRDNPSFRKSREDDLRNMQTGIFGFKGRVHYQLSPCINGWIDELSGLPKSEFFAEVARRMDRDIHRGYRLFPGNYVAADLLEGTTDFADRYTAEEKETFGKYIAGRLALVDLPDKDEDFLRERLLTMYAMPVKNHIAAR